MRRLLLIGFIFISNVGLSQNIEATVSGFGLGNYISRTSGTQTDFSGPSFSAMASILCRRPWVRGGNEKIQFEAGIGLSFNHYKGSWMEFERNRLVGGNIISSDEGWRYTATTNVAGLEITPIIATFWKYLELRTGVFLGMNLTDTYSEEYGRSWAETGQSGVITFYDGAWEEVHPANFNPGFVAHWNTRAALNFKINTLTLSPFYQFSSGLTNEGGTIYDQKIRSWRNHVGLTFRYDFGN